MEQHFSEIVARQVVRTEQARQSREGGEKEVVIGNQKHNLVKVEQESESDITLNAPGIGRISKPVVITGVTHDLVRDPSREDLSKRTRGDAEHMVSDAQGSRYKGEEGDQLKQAYVVYATNRLKQPRTQIVSDLRSIENIYRQYKDSDYQRGFTQYIRQGIIQTPDFAGKYLTDAEAAQVKTFFTQDLLLQLESLVHQKIESEKVYKDIGREGKIRATHRSGDPDVNQGLLAYTSYSAYYRRGHYSYGYILDMENILEIPGVYGTVHIRGKWNERREVDLQGLKDAMVEYHDSEEDVVIEVRIPQDIDVNEYLVGIVEDKEVYVKPEYSTEQQSESDITLSAPFLKDGKVVDPFMDVLPVGAEDIRHPDVRRFIAERWQMFTDEFATANAERRQVMLKNHLTQWQSDYLSRWDTANMSGVMLEIRDMAARSAIASYAAQNDVDYAGLVRMGNDLKITPEDTAVGAFAGEVSPHVAYAAAYTAHIHGTDNVRVEDAGDGLVATFIKDQGDSVEYVEAHPLRRNIFEQLHPNKDITAPKALSSTDVLLTSNRGNMSPKQLISQVKPYGRLVVYGDSDWHRASAHIIGTMKNFKDVATYTTHLNEAKVSETNKQLLIPLFTEWKSIGRSVRAINFKGDGTRYEGESGSVIIVDNQRGKDILSMNLIMDNQQKRKFEDYPEVFERLRSTRAASRKVMVHQRERKAEQLKKTEEAQARAKSTIKQAANNGQGYIYANQPDIGLRVLGITKRVQDGLIPRGQKYNSIEELAVIADVARHPNMATTQILLVKDGQVEFSILGAVRSGEDVRASVEDIEKMMPQAQAEGYEVIAVVNRPSGDTSVSEVDKKQAKALEERYPGYTTTIIRNGDTFSRIDTKRGSDGNVAERTFKQNLPINRPIGQTATPVTTSKPTWAAGISPTRAGAAVEAIKSDFANMQQGHIETISQMTEDADNWAVVAVVNQDGTLQDMVEIRDAFALDAAGASAAITQIKGMYGGADAYLMLASSGNITDNPEFFEGTGWGQYLSGQPNLRAAMLVGAGSHHAQNRIKVYEPRQRAQGRLRAIAKQFALNANASLTNNLSNLMQSHTKGNVWEQAKTLFKQTLDMDFERTAELTEAQETELRNQLNLANSATVKHINIVPGVMDASSAFHTFVTLMGYTEKWQTKTTIPLNSVGLSVSSHHAYLMHYMASAQTNDVVVVPDASEGALVAFNTYDSHIIATDPDPARREQLKQVIDNLTINDASSADLAAYWQQNLPETPANVVLLDSRNPETFWQQLNQSLHTIGDGGRVVAHVMGETLRENENLALLKQYYNVRGIMTHGGSSLVIVDRVPPEGEGIDKTYESVEELLADAEVIRNTRAGGAIPAQTETAPETPPTESETEPETTPEPETEVAPTEAEEQEKHSKPRTVDPFGKETHRDWVESVEENLNGRYDVGSSDGAKKLYEDMMEAARAIPTHDTKSYPSTERPEADVRSDIFTAWDAIVGFTPPNGWDKFIARLTASTLSPNYNPDMVYRFKLYELMDNTRDVDMNTIIDPRTNEVDTLVSSAYRKSFKKPIKLMGETIADAEDAAILFQPFRNINYEKSVFIGVDSEGKVIKTIPMTSMQTALTELPNTFETQRILANNPDVKGFWIVHNHTETSSQLSSSDSTADRNLRKRFGEMFKGLVATNTGEFSANTGTEKIHRREFTKPIDPDFLKRPEVHGILGRSAYPRGLASVGDIAAVARDYTQELADHPDLVTFVFVHDAIDGPGSNMRQQVGGVETHKNLHTLDIETLRETIRDANTRNASHQVWAIVSNPSDPSLYNEGSVLHEFFTSESDAANRGEDVHTHGVFIETDDPSFPLKTANWHKNTANIIQGDTAAGSPSRLQLDEVSGEPFEPRKQRNFKEFLLFKYLAHGNAIDWKEAMGYADNYFDQSLTHDQVRWFGDAVFKDYLRVYGIHKNLTNANVETENEFLILDNLYRQLIDPDSIPAGVPGTVESSGNRHLNDELTYLALNLDAGETLDFAYNLYDESSPLNTQLARDKVAKMSENLLSKEHNRNEVDDDGNPRMPTAIIHGVANRTARGDSSKPLRDGSKKLQYDPGEGTSPLATVRDKLFKLAPGGRLIVRIEGGLFHEGKNLPKFSSLTTGDQMQFNTPFFSKILPAYFDEKRPKTEGGITVAERNEIWDLNDSEKDYYAGMLDEIFNPDKYTARAFIRLNENLSHLVIDKVENTGEVGVDISVNPAPDTRTLVEKYLSLRFNRPRVSSKYLQRTNSYQADSTRPPVMNPESPTYLAAPMRRQVKTAQGELAASLRQPVGVQQSTTVVATEFGTHTKVSESDITLSSPSKSNHPMIVVTGIDNKIDREALEKVFAEHGEVVNAMIPDNYDGNVGWVQMRDQTAAIKAIQAINGASINGAILKAKESDRTTRTPVDAIPTGDPNSPLAWDVLLNNPLVPNAIKDKWMHTFDIKSVPNRSDAPTYVRQEGSDIGKKTKKWWDQKWEGRVGQEFSRPIEHVGRWGKQGKDIEVKVEDTYHEYKKRGGTMSLAVMQAYKALRDNKTVLREMNKGSTEKVYNSQAGFVPAWVRKVPGIRIWTDDQSNVERVMFKDKQLTHQQPDGRWATDLFLSNAPLLDAWINSAFGAQGSRIFPKDAEASAVINEELDKIRDAFDLQQQEVIQANMDIITSEDSLLTPVDSEHIDDITTALNNDNLSKDALKSYAERFGVKMPDEFKVFSLPKVGTMRQWVVIAEDEPRELFTIRQFDTQQSSIAKVRKDPEAISDLSPRDLKRHHDSIELYRHITGRTLIYKPKPRKPIFTKQSGAEFQLYTGRPFDMPRMINWASMNPHAAPGTGQWEAYYGGTSLVAGAEDLPDGYLQKFYDMNKDAHRDDPGWTYNGKNWTLPYANHILIQNFNGFNDMRYDPLEDDSSLLYPSVAYESQPVLGEYALKSGQRIAEILNYGQDGDVIKGLLDELRNPENLDLSRDAKAVLKLRKDLGHNDFTDDYDDFVEFGNIVVPFEVVDGQRRTTRRQFSSMTAADWDALIDRGIVTFVETDKGRAGFYGLSDTRTSAGEVNVTVPWESGGNVSFEIAPKANALIDYALLNIRTEILGQMAQANYRYDMAKDLLWRGHGWNPKLLEIQEIEEKMQAIYANPMAEARLESRKDNINDAFSAMVRREIEKRNSPTRKGLGILQKIATGLLLRLSSAAQIGTFANPVARTGFSKFAAGVRDELADKNERNRNDALGVYVLEVADLIAMSGENVSQENVGFNQKMLGASKYFHWNMRAYGGWNTGGLTNFLRALYNRGNWTPFATIERSLRGTAALAGKHLVKSTLTELLIPGRINVQGQALQARRRQHVGALEELSATIPRLLESVLNLNDPETGKPVVWTPELIDRLTEMSEKEVMDTYHAEPHLAAVAKLTERVMQVMPDYAHFAGSGIHRRRVLSDHPFLRAMFVFQTMMIEQTGNMFKMAKYNLNRIRVPEKVARELAGKDGISIVEAIKLTTPEIWRALPHFTFTAAAMLGAGFSATMLMNLVRFQGPDDEDLAAMTWLKNAAIFGAMTGYVESSPHYRGLERQFVGALGGLTADFIREPIGSTKKYVFRPFPIDFTPALGSAFWSPETDLDITRSIGAGGFSTTGGTSLSGARAR